MIGYYLLASLNQFIWGLTPSASKVVLTYLPVESYSAIRYTFSGLLFLIIAVIKQGKLRVSWEDLPKMAGLGILAYGINSLGTLYGLQIGGVLNFALASSFNAVITAGISILFLKERPKGYFIVAGFLSVIGGFFLFLGKYDVSNLRIAGGSLLLIWIAYALEDLAFVYSKKWKKRYPLYEYLAILQLSAGVFMWGVSLVKVGPPTKILDMPLIGWAALSFVCIFSCAIAYFILYWLLNHLDGHKLAFFDCFHTIAAAFFGAVFFREPFNAEMLIGGILLLAALIVVTKKPRPIEPLKRF